MSPFSRHEDPRARQPLRIAASNGEILPAPVIEERIRPVQDGELVYTSVSQLQKFTPEAGGCPSKWFFRYVLRLDDDPPGKGQERGTAGHKRIEDLLIKNVNVLDRLERNGLKYIPAPNILPDGTPHPSPVLVEHHFGRTAREHIANAELKADGVPVTGYIDLVNPRELSAAQRPAWLKGEPGPGGLLYIKDWKFKKSIELYGSKPWELMNPRSESGIQMIGYAEWARIMFPGVTHAMISHVTFQTGGQPEVVETLASKHTSEKAYRAAGALAEPILLDSARALWETVTRAAIPGMRKAAKAKSHTDVPKNQQVCHKYRKTCPYIATCLDRMARIRAGFSSKAPAPAVQTETDLMGMLSTMTGTPAAAPPPPTNGATAATQAPIQNQSAPVKPAPASAVLTAAQAQPGQDYEVQGRSARYLTTVKHGEHTYAQFTPTAGGPPLMVELTEPLKALAAPLVVPSDAPAPGASKSTAAAVSAPAGAAKSTAAEVIDAELHAVMFGIEVKACVENEKYEVNGQIGTYTGAASRFGFFETTAGIVRLELTDRVKPLKGAPTTAPAQTTAQGPSTGSGPAGNPPQGAEAPKAEGSASGAEVAAAADKPKRKKKLTVDDKTESAPAAVAPEQPAVTSPPVAPEQSAQLKSPTHGLNGLPYGSMAGVHLYFGCSPIGVSTQTLGPYVDTLERELITKGQMGVHDVRVAQDSTFGFNKWKGYLADMARETPPPAGHYIVTGYADERVSVVAETLAQRAEPGAVTRGGG